MFLFFAMGCASKLKEEKDIEEAPVEMHQKIEELLNAPSPDVAMAPTDVGKIKSALKKSKGANQAKGSKSEALAASKSKDLFLSYWPFGLGEKATYVVRYGPIEGGQATIEVASIKMLSGEPVLHYVVKARSHKFFDLFYRVEDTLQTWARLRDHLPLRQEILQNESGEWGRRIVIFDQKKREQHFYSSTTRPGKPTKIIDEKHKLHNYPQDMLGSYFFSRFVKNPKKIAFPVHDRFKHWNNEYIFDGTEEVKTKAGVFPCNRFLVYPRVQGNLEPKGQATVWFSDDEKRVMTKFKVKIKIGSITGELTAYEAGKSLQLPIPDFATPIDLDPSLLIETDS